jgi:hypothetical protein
VASASFLDAVNSLGGRLVSNQQMGGDVIWPGEPNLEGSTAVGLLSAYEMTADAQYETAVEKAAVRIATDPRIRDLVGTIPGYFGDDMYLFTRIGSDPIHWMAIDDGFYACVRGAMPSGTGTAEYITWFLVDAEPSVGVFYLAQHTMAAYAVDVRDKALWRAGLIVALSQVDDTAWFPVMALGVGTWALAQTGPLDSTVIGSGDGPAVWQGKRLQDLPGMLLSHQVPAGEEYAGSFYWRFDHTDGGQVGVASQGYSEDTIYGTMGLLAAKKCDPNVPADVNDAVLAARGILLGGIGDDGSVTDHLVLGGAARFVYSGEMLQVLEMLATEEDLGK